MGDYNGTERQFCGEHGDGVGCVQMLIRSTVSVTMYVRNRKAVDPETKVPSRRPEIIKMQRLTGNSRHRMLE